MSSCFAADDDAAAAAAVDAQEPPSSSSSSSSHQSLAVSVEAAKDKIRAQLRGFHDSGRIPNIIFHGFSSEDRTQMMTFFVDLIYHQDRSKIKANVMYVNCAHGKGIRFIREELKFFAKTNVQFGDSAPFKCIILMNADSLSIDAQSALRRCIELFSNSSRFFLVVENKKKLLKPILSRFCIIHIPHTISGMTRRNCPISLMDTGAHRDRIRALLARNGVARVQDAAAVAAAAAAGDDHHHHHHDIAEEEEEEDRCGTNMMMRSALEIYECGLSAYDLVDFFKHDLQQREQQQQQQQQQSSIQTQTQIINIYLLFEKVKSEFRCEKMLLLYLLDHFYSQTARLE